MKNKSLINLSATLFVLSPVLSNYVLFGPLSIGDFSLIVALILSLPFLKISNFTLVTLLSSTLIITVSISIFIYNDFIPKSFTRASFFLLVISFFLSLNNKYYTSLFNVYLRIAYVFSWLLIFQITLYYTLGISLVMQLPIEIYEPDTLDIIEFDSGGFRAAGVFKEPSYFAIFTIPGLIYWSSKESFKKYAVFFTSMLASTSSLAIGFVILSIYIYLIKNKRSKKELIILVGILPIFLFSFAYFFITSQNIGIIRFFELFQGGGSAQDRFLNIFDIGRDFSIFVNFDFANYILNLSNAWYNSFIYLVANFGLIFLFSLAQFWIRIGIIASIGTILLLVTTHSFSNSFFTLFLVLCYFLNNEFPKHKIINRNFNSREVKNEIS